MLLQPVGYRLLQPAQLHGSLAVSAGRLWLFQPVVAAGRSLAVSAGRLFQPVVEPYFFFLTGMGHIGSL